MPQLINVLKGDMSVVGPRPMLKEFVELYSPEQARRLEVRPGMTGLLKLVVVMNLIMKNVLNVMYGM
jgi:lipopolysaccharide/colanic/teichoic acid biosynthesis glycosyltransferase